VEEAARRKALLAAEKAMHQSRRMLEDERRATVLRHRRAKDIAAQRNIEDYAQEIRLTQRWLDHQERRRALSESRRRLEREARAARQRFDSMHARKIQAVRSAVDRLLNGSDMMDER
jgi:hypothetical protein